MLSDKEQKKEFLKATAQNPDAYYATSVLRQRGFHRAECVSCKKYFWSTDANRNVCGDSFCVGKVDLFANNPSKRQLSFTQVWQTFSEHLKARGYSVISRYPVVARWNPTTDFTMASIAAFQPYVISGEVEPPAKKLVIPQFCLRFGDVDNVGVTGSHCTGFVMIGQHQFVSKSEWDQNQAFEDLLSYLMDVVGLPAHELTLHEDAWAGGGNFGPCMEFFSRGVELCNQVYMMYEQREDGNRELAIKVLDMGLGQERVAWFSQGAPTLYDAAFPYVIAKLKAATNVKTDVALFSRFAPYATLLNLDEVEDIGKAWADVAKHVGIPAAELRSTIEPMTGLYTVAEHARALLIAIGDGGLPGNVGGYYNLRVIFRSAGFHRPLWLERRHGGRC
jgi:alanyl-tRNA synthetase